METAAALAAWRGKRKQKVRRLRDVSGRSKGEEGPYRLPLPEGRSARKGSG